MSFGAVILAGGQSSRMGQDKAFVMLHGKYLLQAQIEIVRAAGFSEILISGRPGVDYSAFGLPVLLDHAQVRRAKFRQRLRHGRAGNLFRLHGNKCPPL